MYQPEVYAKANTITIESTSYFLNKFGNRINWKENGSILDIGTGDGRNISEVLIPFLPNDQKEIIGSDLSKVMIEFARNKYTKPKLKFVELDICTKDTPNCYKNRFDNIFSFFVFHWIKDTRLAFQNVYEMLRPGGEIFFLFPIETPMDEAYEKIPKNIKWAQFGTEKWLSPYYKCPNVQKIFDSILKDIGYVNCFTNLMDYVYEHISEQQIIDLLIAVNPTTKNIPSEDLDEYIGYLVEKFKCSKLQTVSLDACGVEKVKSTYPLIIIHASKPLN